MKRNELKEYFSRAYKGLLIEQDDPFATDDEGGGEEEAADEGGDEEEAADEEGGDDPFAADEGGDEEEGGDDEGGDEEEADKPKADEEDEVRYGKSLDDQLQAIFIDIEADSIKSAQVQEETYSLKRMLLRESEDITIDVDRFAAETARLILNFDAFFNIEELIMTKARSFLLDKHGEDIADEVAELLATRHDIKKKEDLVAKQDDWDEQVPIAVGATSGGGP
jgi:hypothetical protein